jgi:septal ring factor EnvC (AmiA/AmiB activator)
LSACGRTGFRPDCLVAGLVATALLLLAPDAGGETKSGRKPTPASPARPPSKNSKNSPPPSPARQRELKDEQRELQTELAKVKRQLAASEASRSEAADALAELEASISEANRRLHELAKRRLQVELQLTALEERERDAAQRQSAEQGILASLLREQQALTLMNPLYRFIEGKDTGQLARDAEYLAYFSRATQATVDQLQDRQTELKDLKAQSEQKRSDLAKIAEDEQGGRLVLQEENTRRRRALDRLSKQIASQRQSIARMERDDKRLTTLIDQLSKVLAEQARRNAQRAREDAARRAANERGSTGTPKAPAPANAAIPPITAGKFAERRGRLVLPVQGTVTARFGAARHGEGGETGPTWKGIFIQAVSGVEVRAVGDGRVVFAGWLRGFGNLLVIDHGDGFLSIYGNNEALLRNVGDPVAVGEVVALVGNTGGNEHPGLYFELRFQGRPFDPLAWVAAR